MDWIDVELAAAHLVVKRFPKEFEAYSFELPDRVDRSRIEPKAGAYIYRDLEFGLSRDEVVKLLMTDQLYQSTNITVRELIQNSLDALRYRKAIAMREEGYDWPGGKIVLVHALDKGGNEVLRCTDNGVGMTLDVIERFLTRAGRSYYRSYEFERERASFAEVGCDFDPCSQFGIGFMSCFMLGDHITIRTRRYFGPNQAPGKPLLIEINGLSGLLIIREDPGYQEFGTTVEITLRTKNQFFDEDDDLVRLVRTIDKYIRASEFPIEARCEIPDLESSVAISASVRNPVTELEKAGVGPLVVREQDLSVLGPDVRGYVRCSLLSDNDGLIALSTPTAQIVDPSLKLATGNDRMFQNDLHLCLDGIAVWGTGIPGTSVRSRMRSNRPMVGSHSVMLDVRGGLKPPITPARTMPDRPSLRWTKISTLLNTGIGMLWESLVTEISHSLSPDHFWRLVGYYQPWLPWMRLSIIWTKVVFPCKNDAGDLDYRLASSIRSVRPVPEKITGEWTVARFVAEDGSSISTIEKTQDGTFYHNSILEACIMSLVTVVERDNALVLELREPDDPEERWQKRTGGPRNVVTYPVPYAGPIRQYLSVQMPVRTVNAHHVLFAEASKAHFVEEPPLHQRFAATAVECLSHPQTHKLLNRSSDKVTKLMRKLGRLYTQVDWSTRTADLAPPYCIWISGSGLRSITHDDLLVWAQSKSIDTE